MNLDLLKIYESLLNEKAALEKECLTLSIDYFREFGEDTQTLFALKVEVVTLKKKIAFCVKKRYNNEKIYAKDLDEYIDAEIMEYQRKLDELIAYNKEVKKSYKTITFDDVQKIKKIYYKIAHMVHPDLHPEYTEDETIMDLWYKAVNAFKSNDLNTIREVYDKVLLTTSRKDIEIEDVEKKIDAITKEILEIKGDVPYTYKSILNDDEELNKKHQELQKEIDDYEGYKVSLEKELSQFDIIRKENEA